MIQEERASNRGFEPPVWLLLLTFIALKTTFAAGEGIDSKLPSISLAMFCSASIPIERRSAVIFVTACNLDLLAGSNRRPSAVAANCGSTSVQRRFGSGDIAPRGGLPK